MSATIADFEARLAEEDITFDLVRGILDALKDASAEVAALRIQNSGLVAQNLSIRDEVAALRRPVQEVER